MLSFEGNVMRTGIQSKVVALVGLTALGAGTWKVLRVRDVDACGPGCKPGASAASDASAEAIACNLGAFTPEQRRAHEAEGAALVKQAIATIELPDGFEVRLLVGAASAAVHW